MISPTAASRPSGLILRFAIYSAFAMFIAGAVMLWFARNAFEARAERDLRDRASATSMLLDTQLKPSDFSQPVNAERRTELDRVLKSTVTGDVLLIKFWSRDGTVTYATQAALIGSRVPSSELQSVLSGLPKTEIGHLNDEGAAGADMKTIAAYVPAQPGGSTRPVGALELYTDFDVVSRDVKSATKRVAGGLGLALLLLYASLFPILGQVTGALDARTRRLQEQSDELERSIAERRQAFASLREADARYRALVEQLPLVTYVSAIDKPGFSSYVSPQLEPLLGYTPQEWLATPELFWSIIHPDDAERVRREHRSGYSNADSFSTQYRLQAKSGRMVWVEDQVMVIRDKDGQPAQAQGFLVDITARKHTELALGENEERYRSLVANIPGVVFRCALDSDWTMEFISEAIEELAGYPASDFIANRVRTFASVVHPDDRLDLEEQVAAAVAEDAPYTTEYRVLHRGGAVRYVLERGKAVLGQDGERMLDGAIFDVTEVRVAENERLKLAAIVESSDDAIMSADVEGRVTSWNKGAEVIFGYTEEEMLGQSIAVLAPDDNENPPMGLLAAAVTSGKNTHEVVRRRKDGTFINVSITASPMATASGEIVGVSAIAHDITERKQVEVERERFTHELEAQNERLLELDRLKDEFVALVSHELRTPLTSIQGYLELVLDGEPDDLTDEQRQFLAVVQRNAHRLLDLVGDLLFLAQVESGKLALEIGAVDIGAIAAEAVETARPLAEEKNVTITLATSPVALLAGDRARLAQLLDNLISNAIKFTPEGGRVDVRASSSRGNAVVEVRDTGMGIPAHEQKHIFERFFRTTRATEQAIPGTGLGLAISKAIVHAHGGRITLASTEGEGATFRVAVPIRAARPSAEEQSEIAL